jgi:hypothetical protein
MHFLARTVLTAGLACLASNAAAATAARSNGLPESAPINAVSRIIWPARSVHRRRASARYTLSGIAINYGGCLFWACLAEHRHDAQPAWTAGRALARGMLLAASSYAIDQLLLPPPWRPGYRRLLSTPQVVAIYATLAVTLPLRGYLAARSSRALYTRSSRRLAAQAASVNLFRGNAVNRLSSLL